MTDTNQTSVQESHSLALALSWLGVVIPLAWGIAQTLKKALALFS